MKSYRNLFTSGARVPIRDVRYAQSDCGNDGFKLRVDAAGNCRIDYSNGRGKRYALREVEAMQGAATLAAAASSRDITASRTPTRTAKAYWTLWTRCA